MLKRASTKFAHNSTIPVLGANQELKPLQNLITAEKAVVVSLKKLSADYLKASEALKAWGQGNDLGDILSASSSLLKIFSSALTEYASHGDFMRKQLKVIRTKEESLDNLKRRRRHARLKAKDVVKKLGKMSPVHKNLATQKESLVRLHEEIQKMETGIMHEEAVLNDFKRTATKAWMGLKFGGLVECCQKGTITGEFGKLAIAEILEKNARPSMPQSLDPRTQVAGLVEEAYQRVNAVALSITPSVGFRDSLRDQHNRESSTGSTPPACSHLGGSPQTSHEPPGELQPPPTSTLRSRNERNRHGIEPFPFSRSSNGQSRKTSGKSSSGYSPYVPPCQRQLSQGTSSLSLPSSSQQPGVNENAVNDSGVNLCALHRNASSSRPATFPINTPQSLDPRTQVAGLVEETYQRVNAVAISITPPVGFRDDLRDQHNRESSTGSTPPACSHRGGSPHTSHEPPGELQPPPTSTLHSRNERNRPGIEPFPFSRSSNGQSPHVPPCQRQFSQGTSSLSLPSSSQQPGVNESAVNDSGAYLCALHRNASSSGHATSPINTRSPSLSNSSTYHLQDPSLIGRQRIGDSSCSSSMTGTTHSTTSRFNGWSQSSESSYDQPVNSYGQPVNSYDPPVNSCGDALLYNDPPPSFDDALLDSRPVGGSSSEVSLANTVGHSSVRPVTDRGHRNIPGNGIKNWTER